MRKAVFLNKGIILSHTINSEEETYLIEEYKKIKNPDIIQQFQKEMGSYLPKKYLTQK